MAYDRSSPSLHWIAEVAATPSDHQHYQHVMKKQRQARRKIIRQWTALPREKRQSVDQIAAFAKTAAQQNEDAFVHGRRDPYQKITAWLLPRTGRS